MSEKERLIELLQNCSIKTQVTGNISYKSAYEKVADYLLENGVIVLPCEKVYCIADKNTKYATICSVDVQELCVYEIQNLSHYGYYLTREQAEKALKGGTE